MGARARWGPRHRGPGCGGVAGRRRHREEGVSAWAAVLGAHLSARLLFAGAGAARGAGRGVRAFDFARRRLSFASSPFPERGEGVRAVRPALRAPRGGRRVPDAARASFIIIFGQVECARNSCFTRLTSEGGYSGNQGDE